jgi:hypothetical protein
MFTIYCSMKWPKKTAVQITKLISNQIKNDSQGVPFQSAARRLAASLNPLGIHTAESASEINTGPGGLCPD